jgi:hypothetical protein
MTLPPASRGLMFCTQCGSPLTSGARFCTHCGRSLSSTDTALSSTGEVVASEAYCPPSRPAVLVYLESLAHSEELVSCRDFRARLRELGDVNASELDTVVAFSEDQFCRWHVQWLFSPASAPDQTALAERNSWQNLYVALSGLLAQAVSGAQELIARRCDALLVKYVLTAKSRYDQTAPGRQTPSAVLSSLAHGLNAVGLRAIAERTVSSATFPPGTVGRSQPWKTG